ncbi:hypothetical protein SAOR_07990 [Salinisphaera orenii MK-B5]|uniref:Uncharacterized protein n=1 Tax=Salinisphaera orenii MK-B5 TaxID=856730 RepID=A0A423PQS0_9GAMM|nr:hypothetical protein SAOR_07990 [Salinisphaera orenii MK-B5]
MGQDECARRRGCAASGFNSLVACAPAREAQEYVDITALSPLVQRVSEVDTQSF